MRRFDELTMTQNSCRIVTIICKIVTTLVFSPACRWGNSSAVLFREQHGVSSKEEGGGDGAGCLFFRSCRLFDVLPVLHAARLSEPRFKEIRHRACRIQGCLVSVRPDGDREDFCRMCIFEQKSFAGAEHPSRKCPRQIEEADDCGPKRK